MTTQPVQTHGVDVEPAFVQVEDTYNEILTMVATDAVAVMPGSLEIKPVYNWEAVREHRGSATLQDEVESTRGGTWAGKFYNKPANGGTAPDLGELLRSAFTKMQVEVTIIDFSLGELDTLTITENGTPVVFTESNAPGADEFNAETSEAVTATNMAAAITASVSFTGTITAAAVGPVVTISSETSKIDVATGDATAWAPNKVIYAFSAAEPHSFNLVKPAGNELYERAMGAWIDTVEVEITEPMPMFSFAGGFAELGGLRGKPFTDAAGYLIGVTTLNLRANSAFKIRLGAVVKFGTEDNSGAGYTVTAVDDAHPNGTGLILTFTPALANTNIVGETAITPVVPTATLGGDIQSGVECGLEIDSIAVDFNEYKLSVATGIHPLDKTKNNKTPIGLGRGDRLLEGECEFYHQDSTSDVGFGGAANGSTRSVEARIGPDTVNNRIKIITDNVRFFASEVTTPEAEEAEMSAGFMSRKNTINEDEGRIEFD